MAQSMVNKLNIGMLVPTCVKKRHDWLYHALNLLLVLAIIAASPCTCISENSPIQLNRQLGQHYSSDSILAKKTGEKSTSHCQHHRNNSNNQSPNAAGDGSTNNSNEDSSQKDNSQKDNSCGGNCSCANHGTIAVQTYSSEVVKIANFVPAAAPILFSIDSLLTNNNLSAQTTQRTLPADSSPPTIKQHITTRGLGHWLI
ncbi:MAG: hypothetical protein PHC51_13490 [bacterium]|nr:hypothetical protein [bacterium]